MDFDFHEKVHEFLAKIREETPLIRVSHNKLFESSLNYDTFHKHKSRQLFETKEEGAIPDENSKKSIKTENKLNQNSKLNNPDDSFIKIQDPGNDHRINNKKLMKKSSKEKINLTETTMNTSSSATTKGNENVSPISINTSLTTTTNQTNYSMGGLGQNFCNNIKRSNQVASSDLHSNSHQSKWKGRVSTKDMSNYSQSSKTELVRGGSHKVLTSAQNAMKILNNIKKSNSKSTFDSHRNTSLNISVQNKKPSSINYSVNKNEIVAVATKEKVQTISNEAQKRKTSEVEPRKKIDAVTKSKGRWCSAMNSTIYDDIKKKFEMKDQAIYRKHFK